MIVGQISDLHVVEHGLKTLGIAPMAENLTTCVAAINANVPRPDVVVVSGDITDTGGIAEAHHAKRLLDALVMPYHIVPGNHDNRDTLSTAFNTRADHARDRAFMSYVVDDFNLRLIALDSTHPGEPGGQLCAERLAWLDKRLAENPTKPTMIFLHHPPLNLGVLETDVDGFEGSQEFGRLIRQYTNIKRIVCGHVHVIAASDWSGTTVSTCPSMGMRLRLDLTMRQNSMFYLDGPAFQLHSLSSDQNLVTHTIYVRNDDGPYFFDKQDVGR